MEAVSVAPGLFYKGNIKRNTLFPLQTKKKKELIKLSREYEKTTTICGYDASAPFPGVSFGTK